MSINSNVLKSNTRLRHGDVTYTIDRVLGKGGFGITYKAIGSKPEVLNKQYGGSAVDVRFEVAIKELFIQGVCVRHGNGNAVQFQTDSPEEFEIIKSRFLKEANLLRQFARLENIVNVVDLFEANNTAYMVMSYVEGITLRQFVNEHGTLLPGIAVNYLSQIANDLAHVHQAGVLHRDIKPDNILITRQKKAILIDFGAARTFEKDIPVTHTIMMTAGYAPIEQLSVRRERGPYSDIFSLGATLFFCLSGRSPESVNDKNWRESLHLPGTGEYMNRFIFKSMAFEPEDRYQNCHEWVAAMNQVASTNPGNASAQKKGVRTKVNVRVQPDKDITALANTVVQAADARTPSKPITPKKAPKKKRKWGTYLLATLLSLTITVWLGNRLGLLDAVLPSGSQVHLIQSSKSTSELALGLAFDPVNDLVVTSGEHLNLFDLSVDKRLWKSEELNSTEVAFIDEGKTLVGVVNGDYPEKRGLALVNSDNGTVTKKANWRYNIRTFAIAPDQQTMIFSTFMDETKIYKLSLNEPEKIIEFEHVENEAVIALDFRPDGGGLVGITEQGTITLWNPNNGATQAIVWEKIKGTDIAYSPDGSKYGASFDQNVIIYNALNGEPMHRFTMAGVNFTNFLFMPGSDQIVATGTTEFMGASKLYIWDIKSQKLTNEMELANGLYVTKIAFRDDKTLGVLDETGGVTLITF